MKILSPDLFPIYNGPALGNPRKSQNFSAEFRAKPKFSGKSIIGSVKNPFEIKLID